MIKLLGVLGVVLVLTLGVLLVRDPGYIPHFDAARIELADTAAEAECAAEVFVETRFMGAADYMDVTDCVAGSKASQDVDLQTVPPTWCQSFIAQGTWNGTVEECVDILYGEKFWPNLRGGLSNLWVRAFPFPGNLIDTIVSAVRNTVRGETEREALTNERT